MVSSRSGAVKLAEKLHELGYGGKVQPEALEWVFDFPGTRPFLLWLAEHLSKDNSLDESEVESMEALSMEGMLLEGEDLQLALASAKESGRLGGMEGIQKAMDEVDRDIDHTRARIEKMKLQRDMLISNSSKVKTRLEKVKAGRMEEEDEVVRAKARMEEKNEKMNCTLRDMDDASSKLIELLTSHS
eukprot:CAMPEP_0113897174 /NCGR_PEP_ID=MMETSP0780_2-20120614/18508_1 /TAXON_ID=652834 /ORGANISM="Palpitomonas bilix" /LENGTH=186 /DNA_ID=CAMNT_0000888559 /DNA_START=239 /DNA_END=795 /DNA_ORIENTATION=- /assembly_acc=CAM_ASM_000599